MKFYRSIYMRSFKRDFPVVYEVFASGYQRFKQAQLELKARIKQKEGKES